MKTCYCVETGSKPTQTKRVYVLNCVAFALKRTKLFRQCRRPHGDLRPPTTEDHQSLHMTRIRKQSLMTVTRIQDQPTILSCNGFEKKPVTRPSRKQRLSTRGRCKKPSSALFVSTFQKRGTSHSARMATSSARSAQTKTMVTHVQTAGHHLTGWQGIRGSVPWQLNSS